MGSFLRPTSLFAPAFIAIAIAAFLVPKTVEAGNIYISPSEGRHHVGQTFSVNVLISTPAGQSVNAVSGKLFFSGDKLQALSLSKTGSVVNLWVEEPSYSNVDKSVNFSGVILNPGYTGSGGKVISITFKVIAPGPAKLSFSSGSLLANDGNGTNVLVDLGQADLTLLPEAPKTLEEVPPSSQVTPTIERPAPEKTGEKPDAVKSGAPTGTGLLGECFSRSDAVLGLPKAAALSIAISLISTLLLFFALVISRHMPKVRVRSNIDKTNAVVHSVFDNLRSSISDYADILESTGEGGTLTKKNEIIVRRLEQKLTEAEEEITLEVENIRRKKH